MRARLIAGPAAAFEGGPGPQFRNVGWKQGIRIGSARDGSLHQFIEGTNPEDYDAFDPMNTGNSAPAVVYLEFDDALQSITITSSTELRKFSRIQLSV